MQQNYKTIGIVATIIVLVVGCCCVGRTVFSDHPKDENGNPLPTVTQSVIDVKASEAAMVDSYVSALNDIDLDIVHGDAKQAVDRGLNVCSSALGQPGNVSYAVEQTRLRFSSPTHPDGFTGDVPSRIWLVINSRICPEFHAAVSPPPTSAPTSFSIPEPVEVTTTNAPEPVTENNDVYYKNCAAAKADGAAPLHRGDPGYRSGLDRDNDGTACEK